jgi:hypothetical protein
MSGRPQQGVTEEPGGNRNEREDDPAQLRSGTQAEPGLTTLDLDRLNKGNAGRLKASEHIRTRVEELQTRNVAAQQAAMGVTIEQLRAQFAEAYEMAKELSQPAAMVTATTAQAKLAGLWIERSEQMRKQPDEMSDAEIAAILGGTRIDADRIATSTAAQ